MRAVGSPPVVDPARLNYPEQLPVVARKDDIAAAIRGHQVVVVAGETGSGKTTQLPKICLELGLGRAGRIAHTQPRRIAARSVAERIAEEMETELGDVVGYQVRFTDRSSERTRVVVMTDGILLNEMQRDPELRRYEVVIVDEAHERSLNIDFILGYLTALLPRRPDLTVVITSATIDPDRFARHFATGGGGEPIREVPVIEVSGRTYPVELRYRPLVELDAEGAVREERDQVTAVTEAVTELWTESARPGHPSTATDILAFFSGEREIRDAADALRALDLPDTEILPLFARLSAAEQHRVFQRGSRSPGHPRHERRRDLPHGAGHRLRRRHRHGADLAVQPADEGAASPHRAHLPGQREPARRPVRTRRRRGVHPALLGGGLRGQAGVHRAGDPAHLARVRHPPDGGARAR